MLSAQMRKIVVVEISTSMNNKFRMGIPRMEIGQVSDVLTKVLFRHVGIATMDISVMDIAEVDAAMYCID